MTTQRQKIISIFIIIWFSVLLFGCHCMHDERMQWCVNDVQRDTKVNLRQKKK